MQLIFDILGWIIYKVFAFLAISLAFVIVTAFCQWVITLDIQNLPPLTVQTQQILEKIPAIAFNDPQLQVVCTEMSIAGQQLQQSSQDFLQRQQAPNPFLSPIDYYLWKTAEHTFVKKTKSINYRI
ncbi:hypothetical protein [Beggiatoa leptomitoformis]|uniref:Uncharacterized protein n=1 Tax=Beggiatoa leptomitoformis TaxID=288004 RepID=A0A2N9YG02_9GAMM|nr:hypothetical protein [Beggiatoa leptomitoformis]ALG68245.1 hypothetical protein AL038_11650 [Beggiatoa leptomitoformis]AUI69448.1 hypothetical protein BLE401_12620 [Beggiatoa leptomitoformis]